MSEPRPQLPFQTLGVHLKYLREQAGQTLAEVSGAVEIDQNVLEQIETGQERPAEDVLLLLINYFDTPDREADQLWQLAGYDSEAIGRINGSDDAVKSVVLLLAQDLRAQYTDGIDISYNEAGVNLTFTQATGQDQTTPVARVGMSYEQAAQVSIALQRALLQARYNRGPHALPPESQQ
ncbi:MAG TPA: helix-turn-helix transcriptional regulator [Candidatus Saccharimonadales bacterium]|nr:helix-turn-helix transcriptional regulator [Candidatus Saccharimonadales bacterium]